MSILTQFAQASGENLLNDTTYDEQTVANIAIFGTILMVFFFVAIATYALVAWVLGRIFKKAGEPQWKAWVPVYNNWVLLELGGQKGFWAIVAFIPFIGLVSLVFMYIAMYHIGLRFQKEPWFVVIAIFLPLVWLLWLAFDDSKWHVPKKLAPTFVHDTTDVAKK